MLYCGSEIAKKMTYLGSEIVMEIEDNKVQTIRDYQTLVQLSLMLENVDLDDEYLPTENRQVMDQMLNDAIQVCRQKIEAFN